MGLHRKVITECKCCGKRFAARLADIRIGWGEFCSRSCRNTGAFNPMWRNGGLTKYQYKLRAKAKNPDRFKAMQSVQTAIRNGSLTPKPCRECGSIEVEAHHADYSKPLDVEWLCKTHHFMEHGK